MSWVVGHGCGCGSWVKKMFSKKKNGKKFVKFMKQKSPHTYQESYSSSPRSAKQMSESLVQMDTKKVLERKIKETLYTM